MSRPQPMSPAEATKKINDIAVNGTVIISSHCRRDSMPKRSVSFADIYQVLQHGTVNDSAEWDNHYGEWKYRVEGIDTFGDELTAITVVYDDTYSCLVVTVF